jgi:hypothetical protein
MNRLMTLALLAASLCVVACEEQKPAAPGTGTESTKAAAVQIKDEDIPTAADFDQESAKDITTDNYKAEVDSLEKEIGE